MVRGTCRALCGLSIWMPDPRFLTLGPSLEACYSCNFIMTDLLCAGEWSQKAVQLRVFGRAVFLAIKYFLQDLWGYHVLVRMDNTWVVSYINHKCGFRSRPLFRLVQHCTRYWYTDTLTEGSLHPGTPQFGSRCPVEAGTVTRDCQISPQVVKSIWQKFGKAEVHLFGSEESTNCPLWFSLHPSAHLGRNAMVQMWPRLCL